MNLSRQEFREDPALRQVPTIVGVLRSRASIQGAESVFTYLSGAGAGGGSLTFSELDIRARAIAARLLRERLGGERVLLVYPPGLEFVEAFFGCLYAGTVAVPAIPPRVPRGVDRLATIASDAGALAALAPDGLAARWRSASSPHPTLAPLRWLATGEASSAATGEPWLPEPDPDAVAYLQYTSGSTSTPKGVVVSHANLMANSDAIRRGFGHTGRSRSLSWLPHFHDMGLVDGIVQPVYSGYRGALMSPTSFLESPARWLEAISTHAVTHSGGPNFAYELCLRRVESDPARLDLRSWAVAYNGAEPIRAETLERFAAKFESCGFRRESFYPAYGLAEATLKVSGGARGEGPTIVRVSRPALEGGRAEDDATGLALVGSGRAESGTRAAIVDPESGSERGENEVGEIWVSGPGVAVGYWRREAETERTFGSRLAGDPARFLRTGDLGFLRGGELFVTGRLKDLVIIRGRNVHPEDVERTVESFHPAPIPGGTAAFGVEVGGEERLVLVHEIGRRAVGDGDALLASIRAEIVETHEVDPWAVVLVRPASVPRTSSGKVQRAACRSRYLDGTLHVLAEWRAAATPESTEDLSAAGGRAWIATRVASKLGVGADSIDLDAPLARLGLDSLRSIELAYEIEQRFGVVLSAADLLAASSLAEIAAAIERPGGGELAHTGASGVSGGAASSGGRSIGRVPRGTDRGSRNQRADRPRARREGERASDPGARSRAHTPDGPEACALSIGQRGLWFLQGLAPESAAYTIAAALALTGPLDEEALARAARRLVARHPSLRARIVAERGEPLQRFDVPFEAIFHRGDLTDTAPADLAARIADDSHTPFDLERGPLFRLALHRTGEGRLLLVSAHHAVADLWSLSVALRDLQRFYAVEIGGERPADAPAPHPAEFVRWQTGLLESEAGERQLAYWRERLTGDLPALDLPTDRPRPRVKSYRGGARRLCLDPSLVRALRDLARMRGVTLYTLLLAGYQSFLSRITGQRELLVGSPVSGRTDSRFADLAAYVVNTVVLRAGLSGDPRFVDLLAETRDGVAGALANQDYPFAALVKRLAPAREPSRSPLFDTMFDLRAAGDLVRGDLATAGPGAKVEFAGGVVAEPVEIERRAAPFDLSVTFTSSGSALSLELEHNSDLFEASTIDELARGLVALLGGVAADPSTRLSRLPLMAAGDRMAVLRESSARSGDEAPVCVHRLFEKACARSPDAVAAWHAGAPLTYTGLNRRANALARRLAAAGVGPESTVAVCLDKSLDLLVALLAVLKAGGAYVPVDPALPAARRRFLVADAGCRVVLARAELEGDLPPDAVWIDPAAGEGPAGAAAGGTDFDGGATPDTLAYVVYTSGTTGTPKGVGVTHGSLWAAYRAWDRVYDLSAIKTHLQMASPGFDVFTGDLVRALGSGGTLVLCDRETLVDPPALAALVRAHHVEFGDFVPAVMRGLAAHIEHEAGTLDTLEIVAVGSDAWSMTDEALFRRALGPRARLLNSYGVTEATIDSLCGEILEADAGRLAPPMGRPLAHTAAHVLDETLEPLPAGLRGELYLGGPAVARGYVGRPDLTAERFLPDPHGEPGARMYRTGDRVRRLADGRIEFVGRADAQVKIRGYRVEPAEIEAALESHPGVRGCAVVARESSAGRRLIAYVVRGEDGAPSGHARDESGAAAELRGHVEARLPDYMIPATFVFLDALPLSANGKIDRRALPEPQRPADSERSDGAGGGRTERLLAGIWERLLDVPRARSSDNFFGLGGDSILGIQLVARAREAGLRISPRMLFEHPALADLARAAEASGATEGTNTDGAGEAPLTPIQHWFFAQDPPEPGHWNMAAALDATEPLDPASASLAARAIVDHHDALRARFSRGEAGWRQVVGPPGSEQPVLLAVETRPDEDREEAVGRCARTLHESLDIERGPLIRFGIVSGGERAGVGEEGGAASTLVVVAHHLVMDGVSLRLVVEDFDRAYRAARSGAPIDLPAKTAPVGAWAGALADATLAGRFDAEIEWWRRLEEIDVADLPLERSGDLPLEGTTETATIGLDEEATRALVRGATASGAGVESLLLAALAAGSARLSGRATLYVEIEGHGRDAVPEIDVSRTVGWFTATHPVLVEGADPASLAATLAAVIRARGSSSGAGFGALRHLSRDPRVRETLSRVPAPRISFNYLGRLDSMSGAGSIFGRLREPGASARSPRARRTHALEIDAGILEGRLFVRWSYSREQLGSTTVERLAAAVRDALAEIARPHRSAVSEIDEIEEVLALAPMQEGMLFHHLRDRARDPYVAQIALDLEGDIDAECLAGAWRIAFETHPALRSRFVWEGVEHPVQEILRAPQLPVLFHDAGGEKLETILERARAGGFDLSSAPLARVDLVRTGARGWTAIFTHHHLLLDGWSLPLVLETVFGAYEALESGRTWKPPAAPDLRRYLDWIGARDAAAAERFFRGYLAGFASRTPAPDPGRAPLGPPAATPAKDALAGPPTPRCGTGAEEIPPCAGDSPGLAPQTSGVVRSRALPDVTRRARALGLTPSTVLQAGWALVLAACSGDRDVLFGATSSGRPPEIEGIERLVGLCISTLPVRVRVDPRARAREWMLGVQRLGADLREYEYAPLALVQRCAPTPPGEPLFETLLVFENYPIDLAALGRRERFSVSAVHLHEETSYPLTIVATEEDGLCVRAIFDRSRFEEPAVRLVLGRLGAAVEGLLSRPDARLAEISVLAPGERALVLETWNETRREYPRSATIAEIFDRVARERPEETALVFDGGSSSYGELRRRARTAAAALCERGVGRETRVALAIDRSPDLVVAILGVLGAGGAYVPIDPESPPARTARMLEDASVSLVVTDGRREPPQGEWTVLALDELRGTGRETPLGPSTGGAVRDTADLSKARARAAGGERSGPLETSNASASSRSRPDTTGGGSFPLASAGPQGLAYVMFTSGSTGEPKGIEVTHRNVLRLVLGAEYVSFGPGQTILQFAPPAFDASTFEIWGALLTGGRLAIAPAGAASAAEIARLLERFGATTLWLTAGLFHVVADEEPRVLARLPQLLAGGDVLSPGRVRRILEMGCGRLVNGYGPTETTTFACCEVLEPGGEVGERVPIGSPVANTRVYVLDQGMRPAPIGAPGELFIGGDGVSRGYARRPALTAERFVPDPFGPPGSRLYRSGDIVRWRVDGRIEFLGRRDGQVKIRGFRVEIGEVEAALAEIPWIRAAAVVASGADGDAELAGYVVPVDAGAGDARELRVSLAARLPQFMIPARFVFLDALPLTPNGKIDRSALPEPARGPEPAPRAARTMTPVEEAVAVLWRRVLGIEEIGPDDDFFELGGHSLHATRLLSALRRGFRVDLPMAALFETTTVGGVARALVAREPAPGHVERAARAIAKLRAMTDPGRVLEPSQSQEPRA